jgi:hypothetical protein
MPGFFVNGVASVVSVLAVSGTFKQFYQVPAFQIETPFASDIIVRNLRTINAGLHTYR